MDQQDDFDSVSWRHDPVSDGSRPTTAGTEGENDVNEPYHHQQASGRDRDVNGKRRMSSTEGPSSPPSTAQEAQAGPRADAVDLAGIGDGVLECRVDSPLKENDGTKDAYISYLVTTHVS